MGLIELEGMEFYASHGHFEAERIVGNKFIVYVSIKTNCSKAGETDKLEDALNYQIVYNLVKAEMKVTSLLLENVAKRILDKIYARFPSIEEASVKVSKINPSMGGQIEKVSLTLTR